MKRWSEFLQSIETEGGSILILILLIVMFSLFVKMGFKDAESQVYFILGALVGLLKGNTGIDTTKTITTNDTTQTTTIIKD
jgi:hypothetical protein